MTTYTPANIQAVLQQVSASRVALYQELKTDLDAITAKLDQAAVNMLFADGEPMFIGSIRATINAFDLNVVPIIAAAAPTGE